MRQLIKFCLVGGSSTVINVILYYLLLTYIPVFPWWVSQTIAFVISVFNGFYWNRRWTFAGQLKEKVSRQLPIFLATNTVGWGLNLMITKGFLWAFTGELLHKTNPNKFTSILAMLCAVPIVVIWNFSASRLWTFRKPATIIGGLNQP